MKLGADDQGPLDRHPATRPELTLSPSLGARLADRAQVACALSWSGADASDSAPRGPQAPGVSDAAATVEKLG